MIFILQISLFSIILSCFAAFYSAGRLDSTELCRVSNLVAKSMQSSSVAFYTSSFKGELLEIQRGFWGILKELRGDYSADVRFCRSRGDLFILHCLP